MTDELIKIREAFKEKARKDRKKIKDEMSQIFGYKTRNVEKKIKGTVRLTDREKEYLFRALKIKK